jgi:tRNA threonylcarbamoyladenosine biosynthesis protein TsaB
VLQVDTLCAVAADAHHRARTEDVWVVMDARMNEVYAGHYRCAEGCWQAVMTPKLYTLDALQSCWQKWPPHSVAGTALEAFGPRLKSFSAQLVTDAQPRGHALIACARSQWAHGAGADPSTALPRYLRDRVALTVDERTQAEQARLLA